MRVWITKCATTHGIIEAEAEIDPENPRVAWVDLKGFTRVVLKPDWHDLEIDARIRASDMINGRLRSLEKERQRLLSLLPRFG